MYGVKVWGFRSGFLRTRQHPLNFTCLGHQGSWGPMVILHDIKARQLHENCASGALLRRHGNLV